MKNFQNPITIFITVLLLLLLLDFLLNSKNIINSIYEFAPFVQGFATVILVLITAFYARSTSLMAKEMHDTRMDQFLPVLSITISPHSERVAQLGIHNMGKGPATDIIASSKDLFVVKFDQIENGHYSTKPLKKIEQHVIKKMFTKNSQKSKAVLEYTDIFGRQYKTEAQIHTTKNPESGKEQLYTKSWKTALPLD